MFGRSSMQKKSEYKMERKKNERKMKAKNRSADKSSMRDYRVSSVECMYAYCIYVLCCCYSCSWCQSQSWSYARVYIFNWCDSWEQKQKRKRKYRIMSTEWSDWMNYTNKSNKVVKMQRKNTTRNSLSLAVSRSVCFFFNFSSSIGAIHGERQKSSSGWHSSWH